MPDGIDPGFDSAMVGSADWPGVVVNLANQGSTITLLVAVLTLGILIVMALQPTQAPAAPAPALTIAPREGLSVAWLAGAAGMATIGGESTVATLAAPVELLQAGGLTPTDVLALTALRERVQRGRVAEEATPDERLTFARWLADQGKIGQ